MSYTIDIREEEGVRTLHFGSEWVQGAMRIARPWNLELEYTREMMTALLLRDPPKKVLIIGLGTASLMKFLYRNFPLTHLTIVEIEPAVVDAARQYFKLPEDPKRINLVIGDGAEYVQNKEKKFDLIMVDGFDEKANSSGLDTLPFYQMCRTRLSRNGLMVVNLLTRSQKRYNANVNRISEAFDDRVLAFPSCESGNAIAIAATGEHIEIPLDDLKELASELKEESGLNLLPTIARLKKAQSCLGGILKM